MQNKYSYVHVTPETAQRILHAAGKSKRDLQLNDNKQPCEVTLRPMFGLSVFVRHRPFYVLPVGRHTCVCQLCYGMRLIFASFFTFPWSEHCPALEELIADVKRKAGGFSPTTDALLECLLCDRNIDTDFFSKLVAMARARIIDVGRTEPFLTSNLQMKLLK